jgi:hypothetical protein
MPFCKAGRGVSAEFAGFADERHPKTAYMTPKPMILNALSSILSVFVSDGSHFDD